MRNLSKILGVCVLSMALWAGCGTASAGPCQSDANCNDGSDCTVDTCSGGTCSYVPLDSGTACNDGACMDGRCRALETVIGWVSRIDANGFESEAAGAIVSAHGTTIRTTTDEYGWFEFGVPVGTAFIHASTDGAWGLFQPWPPPYRDVYEDLYFPLYSDAFLAPMENALGIKFDETKGIVEAWYYYGSGRGGDTLKLGEPYGVALTVDAEDNFVLSAELQPGVEEPWLLFIGVNVTDALTVEPVGVGDRECRLGQCTVDPGGFEWCGPLDPEIVFPVVAKSFTSFWVECASWL